MAKIGKSIGSLMFLLGGFIAGYSGYYIINAIMNPEDPRYWGIIQYFDYTITVFVITLIVAIIGIIVYIISRKERIKNFDKKKLDKKIKANVNDCPKCGWVMLPDIKKCPSCGYILD